MRLSSFLLDNVEAILKEWEDFAATLLPAAEGMTSRDLRDHAREILEAVAHDLETPQTRHEQAEKSKGRAPEVRGTPDTAAQTHAVLRAESGFDINQLVAEYRALRASVLRLWMDAHVVEASGFQDMLRFNEAIDQAIAESVRHFQEEVDQARKLFLGMLEHDMRTPLAVILATASRLRMLDAGEKVSVSAERLIRSGASVQALLDDMADFNRTELGLGIAIKPCEIDLAGALEEELEQLREAHPGRRIELISSGDTRGCWDGARLQQALRNLVANAIKYGDPEAPVGVAIRDEGDAVRLEVSNRGPEIDPAVSHHLFDPLRRGMAHVRDESGPDSLGLGLFIVKQIVDAHAGDVALTSGGGETTCVVRLPRRAGTPLAEHAHGGALHSAP
jgi:hypothetical protein